MLRADRADVTWSRDKKRWEARIQVGAEVVKRPIAMPQSAGEQDLKKKAVEIAQDEGYALEAANVVLTAVTNAA